MKCSVSKVQSLAGKQWCGSQMAVLEWCLQEVTMNSWYLHDGLCLGGQTGRKIYSSSMGGLLPLALKSEAQP